MKNNGKNRIIISLKRILLASVFVLSLLQINQTLSTSSFFSDREQSEKNVFAAGTWSDEIEFGDLVINEIMWMGSWDIDDPKDDGPDDQWIELKNVSDKDIQIKDWYLTFKNDSGNIDVKLASNNRVIKPGEFYLMSHNNHNKSAIDVIPAQFTLDNFSFDELEIELRTDTDVLIDEAGNGGYPEKGIFIEDDIYYSMERNDPPGEGDDYANWHTCDINDPSVSSYWDSGRLECGTPGGENTHYPIASILNSIEKKASDPKKVDTSDQQTLEVEPPADELIPPEEELISEEPRQEETIVE